MPCKSPNPALAVGFGSNLSQVTRYFGRGANPWPARIQDL
jgi:hypothetical protein